MPLKIIGALESLIRHINPTPIVQTGMRVQEMLYLSLILMEQLSILWLFIRLDM